MTGRIKTYNDFKAGKDTGEKAAREKAIQLAERADRDKR